MLDKRELNGLARFLNRRTPYIDIPGKKQSRRIQGMREYTVESREYQRILVYIQDGLGSYQDAFKLLFRIVNSKLSSEIKLFVFGSEREALKSLRASLRNFPDRLAENLGTSPNNQQTEIGGEIIRKLNSNELVLFVGKNRQSYSFFRDASIKVNRTKHIYCIYVDDEIVWQTFAKHNSSQQCTRQHL
ncbi:MAG: hypothetical protein HQM14_17520 [SAR324 cluster bacterium]|nr:hypothetical protein [SAR324 cluster bacterium]